MLITIAIVVFWVLIGLVLVQAALVAGFVFKLLRAVREVPDDGQCPKAAVVLCLRGTDPYLPNCIEALLNLDYPCYDVKIVVDDLGDPSWQVVEDTVARHGATNVEIQVLTQRRETCSLKCSSLVQAVSQLDKSYEVVAQLDADAVVHPSWLRELVAPLRNETVGAVTGNRWYMPEDANWGSLIRYLWNVAAVVQMCWYRIAWGGTLAVRTEVFRQSDLLERWGNAFCEDTMLFKVLRDQGLRVAFAPTLMMVNRETCDIGGYFRWVRRQLLTARLYHPGWLGVLAHGISTALLPLAAIGLLVAASLTRQWEVAAWAGAGILLYQTALSLAIVPMEFAVRRVVALRNEETDWLSAATSIKYLPAVALTQIIYAAALTSTLLLRTVDWRGVSYRIDGPWKIRLIDYWPFVSEESDDVSMRSL